MYTTDIHMKKTMLRWVICAMTASPLLSVAQSTEPTPNSHSSLFGGGGMNYRTFSIGINGGITAPSVLIGGSNDFTKSLISYGYGAYAKWQILHFFSLRADYMGGRLKGDQSRELGDGSKPNRAVESFETKLKWTASLSGVFNFATINWAYRKPIAQLYASVGGGLAGYSPTIKPAGGTETDYKTDGNIQELIIPVGAGIKFRLNDFMNLDLGYTMNFTDGDNLDGFKYGTAKDKFSYGYAGLEFALGSRTKPQLQWHNAPAVMYDDLAAQRDRLKAELDAANANNAKLAADVAKLQTDSDGDGVSDIFDKCPDTKAGDKVDGSGCPLPKPEVVKPPVQVIITDDDRRLVRNAIDNLEFETGKSNIKPKSYASLDEVASLLTRKNLSLKLAGHTDNTGNRALNMRLSKDRAESVKAYLVGKGVNPSRIEATGYGQDQPIATNKTAAGRQQNRRVEFTIY